MSKQLKIACIGEAMVEISVFGDNTQIGFAGDTLNTAIYMRRNISAVHQISFVTVLGNDPLSAKMLDFMRAEGVSTNYVKLDPERLPGLYAIHTADDGERSFSYWREHSAARTLFEEGFDDLNDFDVIYLSGITLAILSEKVRSDLLDWLSNWSGVFVFDSNYRPKLWASKTLAKASIERAWRVCDIGLPSVDDEIALFEDETDTEVLERLSQLGIRRGALKRGAGGPISLSDRTMNGPIFPVAPSVIDTTAAGDSFNGAYLAAVLSGVSESKALLAGHLCAIEVIGYRGAIIPHPR